jgi:DNA-directed RNA polymerase specialized sigma24 family protein
MHIVKNSSSSGIPSTRSPLPLFSENDYKVVRHSIRKLSRLDQVIVQLRFWHHCEIMEIAGFLKLSWDEVYNRLEASFKTLRESCLSNSNFSRSKQSVPMLLRAA